MPDHDAYFLYDDSDMQAFFRQVFKRIEHPKDAYEVMGEIVHTSILRNFEAGGRPDKWADLKESTKKQRAKKKKWPGQILVVSGARNGLMGSISYDAQDSQVVFVANKPYAAIQHHGGMAGKNRTTEIPARPYMMIQDEDWDEIRAVLNDFIIRGVSR